MLKQLRISNIILIESAIIDFKEGFNVLSGETGSGKSAILNAISLISGERAETGIIRKGAEKAIVEAVFDIKEISAIQTLLEQSGIDLEAESELYIRREILASGKSRAFINNQLAQLSVLRGLCVHLLHLVGQHANQDLLSLERHREILDVFGGYAEDVKLFSLGWEEENRCQKELDALIAGEAQRLREIEMCQRILEELEEAQLKKDEEEELFKEYTLLAHAEEIGIKVEELCFGLQGDKTAVLSHLFRMKSLFEYLNRVDATFGPIAESFQNATLELQEIANTLHVYQSRLEYNPVRLSEVNERLTLITRLKKKYGATLEDIHAFADENRKRLIHLENADERIEELTQKVKILKDKNNEQAAKLTTYRKQVALHLAAELKRELHSLNMPQVDFQIEVTSQKRTRFGDDRIEFFLLPNIGEHRIPVKDCASGGELSRVMLSLQTVLSGKQSIPTLVFDEIDSNIGGETASIVGGKLKAIGQKQQVLCITHFPQVARFADSHLQISKKVVGDRTVTCIQLLLDASREQELARMSGMTI